MSHLSSEHYLSLEYYNVSPIFSIFWKLSILKPPDLFLLLHLHLQDIPSFLRQLILYLLLENS